MSNVLSNLLSMINYIKKSWSI